MIAHITPKMAWDYEAIFAWVPTGATIEMDQEAKVPYLTLEQHEIDQCPDEIPEF